MKLMRRKINKFLAWTNLLSVGGRILTLSFSLYSQALFFIFIFPMEFNLARVWRFDKFCRDVLYY